MAGIASITLQTTDAARPIIESILEDNANVSILNMPGAIKMDREGRIVVNRASVEKRIGRTWDPQELHLVLISMAGNVDEDDDYFALEWKR